MAGEAGNSWRQETQRTRAEGEKGPTADSSGQGDTGLLNEWGDRYFRPVSLT